MPVADLNGHAIYFEDSGGGGPAVLFSHGFLMDHTMFDAQVEALAPEFRCIRWDERGFGRTEARGPFTYWDSADDCIGLLDHLGLARAVLVGMSQGGFLSLRAALRHPARVRALGLIDTQSCVEDPAAVPRYQAMIDHWVSDAPLDPVASVVGDLILGDPALKAEWITRWKARDRASLRLPGECLLGRDDITARLSEIRCPAIVFHGSEDQAIPLERAEILQKELPGCQDLVVILGAAHAPNMTHAGALNGPLLEFLRGLPAS